jgi:N-glycosylase/DNA lyase
MLKKSQGSKNHKEKIMSTTTHDEIVTSYETYLSEQSNFENKGVKASAARARKALGAIGKLSKARRKEIQEKKNNL